MSQNYQDRVKLSLGYQSSLPPSTQPPATGQSLQSEIIARAPAQEPIQTQDRPVFFQPNQLQIKQQFTIDRQEYQSVFRMFDKDNSGFISIDQVNQYIQKFDDMHAQSNASQEKSDSAQFKRAQNNPKSKVQLGGATQLTNNLSGVNSRLTKQTTLPSASKAINPPKKNPDAKPQQPPVQQNGQSNKAAQQQSPNVTSYGVTPTSNTKQPVINQTKANGIKPNTERNQQQINTTDFNGSSNATTAVSNSKPARTQHNQLNGTPNTQQISGTQNPKQLGISPQKKQSNVGASPAQTMQLKLAQNDSFSSGAQNRITNNSQNNSEENNGESIPMVKPKQSIGGSQVSQFPNGKQTLRFDEFIDVIRDSCTDAQQAENYLVFAFSMFDRKKKGYITSEDLKIVFQLLGNEVTDEELKTMVKIAGVKSNDKINFKEFVDFFYKAD